MVNNINHANYETANANASAPPAKTTKIQIFTNIVNDGSGSSSSSSSNSSNNNTTNTSYNSNSMNFNELSNCIVTIESNQNENSIDGNDVAAYAKRRNNTNNHNAHNTITTKTGTLTSMLTGPLTSNTSGMAAVTTRNSGSTTNNSRQSMNNNVNKCCGNEITINQLNEFEQLLSSSSKQTSTSLPVNSNSNSNSNINCNSTTVAVFKTNVTNKPCVNAVSNFIAAPNQSSGGGNSSGGNEFVSFEYVKKLLSETFDYMGDEDNDEDNEFAVAERQRVCSISSVSNSNEANDEANVVAAVMKANNTCNSADISNNFDMEYLSGFI